MFLCRSFHIHGSVGRDMYMSRDNEFGDISRQVLVKLLLLLLIQFYFMHDWLVGCGVVVVE